MMKRHFAILFLVMTSLVLLAGPLSAKVTVLEDTPSYLELQVIPEGWMIIEAEDGIIPMPFGAGLDERAGGQATPYYRRLIGLPSGKLPQAQLTQVTWGELVDGVLPVGQEVEGNDRVPHLSPDRMIQFGAPYMWRNQWVTDIYIVPVSRQGKQLRKLESATIRIAYPEAQAGLVRKTDPMSSQFLVNPVAAQNWQHRKSGRSAFSFEDLWPSGEMFKIEISQEGIYSLTRADLESAGIDLSGFDPRTFRIFGNGGFMLPEDVSADRDEELIENAILVVGEDDGSWDEGDEILFFARGVNSWEPSTSLPGTYKHVQNLYTRNNVYWLNVPDDGSMGKRMDPLGEGLTRTFVAEWATSRVYMDNDAFVFYSDKTPESGKSWYAADLYAGGQYNSSFQLDSPIVDQEAQIKVGYKKVYVTGESDYDAVILVNGVAVDTVDTSVSNRTLTVPANVLRNGSNSFTFRMLSGRALFDYFELAYIRSLETSQTKLEFDALQDDGVAEIDIEGLTNPWIFNIEDFDNVSVTRTLPFKIETSYANPHRVLAISDGSFLSPSSIQSFYRGWGEYPDGLRQDGISADAIFIVHPDFAEAAAELESYVEERDDIQAVRVRTTDIYNEFSWGLFDPTAIRDFLEFAKDNWSGTGSSGPTVCLLIGDGDYDYRNVVSSNDKNWVPPYETGIQCRDDWFATFTLDGDAEYIMGRLPFQKVSEVENYTERLITYENDVNRGPWRSKVIMVADDEYIDVGPTTTDKQHMAYSEELANTHIPDYMQIEKIYIGPYPTEFDPTTGARTKPGASQDLIETINRGALLINYMGHGNAHVWAHENLLLDSRDVSNINSGLREPIYVAATCSWGYFDRPDNEACFEQLLAKSGGAIGVMAASRNTSGYGNNNMVKMFYQLFFDREEPRSLGECLYLAKIETSGATNKYYHCFADPLMMPAVPRLDLTVEEILPDSLISMQVADINGCVHALNGTVPVTDFEGEALVTVYDSYDTFTYTYFDDSELDYRMPGGIMFRGNVGVYEGDFNARFVVPKDVNYGSTDGWVVLYGTGNEKDAIGSKEGIHISSTFPEPSDITDHTPPEIAIFFNHRGWQEGDLTDIQPTLLIDLVDSSGINLTGEIGHDIKVTVDPGTSSEQAIVLNEDFIYERDSYTAGTAERLITGLEPGPHELEVRAWDNANNMALERIQFVTADSDGDLILRNVFNVPNPFKDQTHFTFETIRADEVTIRVYTPSGRHIKTIGPVSVRDNFNYIEWDGRDHYGDDIANGVYLYTVKVSNSSGQSEEAVGKLLRIR